MNVRIRTPSRLHMGIMDLNGNLGRLYGSVGVAIDAPAVILEARPAEVLEVTGKERETVESIVSRFSEKMGFTPKARIEVRESIPAHSGLGSGTQLSLAVGTALSVIHGLDAPAMDIACALERGRVSGVGINSFVNGGFVVDSGVSALYGGPPKPVYHCAFPGSWEFVIAVPEVKKRFYGTEERDAFTRIVPGSEKTSQEICRMVNMRMLPALIERDIEAFGSAMTAVDRLTGSYFSGEQGGVNLEGPCGELIDHMLESGAYGAGQSSWGPAVYCLVKSEYAGDMASAVTDHMSASRIRGNVFCTPARNSGADIEITGT